ncbi:MAG: methionine gamma-lyase [Anaerolineales bacterium]
MHQLKTASGIGTLVTHMDGHNDHHAHVMPIYQTSTFSFPDVATGAALFGGQQKGYIYSRLGNPNYDVLTRKYAALEAFDLLQMQPEKPIEDIADGLLFTSGMAAISTALLACLKSGDTVIAQEAVYGGTFTLLHNLAPGLGINVVWLSDPTPEAWEAACAANPDVRVLYAESPANPTMSVVDLAAAAEIAHRYDAWLMVDNTFATPYCQRPFTLGADVVIHSTTKYLTGHGVVVGGAVLSTHLDWVRGPLKTWQKSLGGTPSPFDAWLADLGLKTFEVRMQRHCENAMQIARYLETHPKVGRVFYPGLESDPGYEIASRQMMNGYGGMISFELKGGRQAGETLMNNIKLATLAVSLGNVDTLIEHPASMTHAGVPREERLRAGLTDGLVRLSVGIENVEDILADLEQGLACIA